MTFRLWQSVDWFRWARHTWFLVEDIGESFKHSIGWIWLKYVYRMPNKSPGKGESWKESRTYAMNPLKRRGYPPTTLIEKVIMIRNANFKWKQTKEFHFKESYALMKIVTIILYITIWLIFRYVTTLLLRIEYLLF